MKYIHMHMQQVINIILFLLDVCTLPGEVEEVLPAYTSTFSHHTRLELSSNHVDHREHSPPSNTESQVYIS